MNFWKKANTDYPVLAPALVIIGVFSVFVFLFTSTTYAGIEQVSLWIRGAFGHYYLYLGLASVLLLLALAISPWGKIKLGQDHEKPQYSLWAWSSMLYSAGMGAGILLRAVQEPVMMRESPPFTGVHTPEVVALEFTFYQWGFTPWAFYCLFAVIIGYALFREGRPIQVSSSLPRHWKSEKLSRSIDVIAVLTTVFGLISSIGLGTAQINGGLDHLYQFGQDVGISIFFVVLICALGGLSVWLGVDKGIKLLSKINISLTLVLLTVVIFQVDALQSLALFGEAFYSYVVDFVPLSLAAGRFDPGIGFLTDWTYYYWAFWLAWAPFTGVFIARISRGRSLRQIILGGLILPSLGTFIWFSFFGQGAYDQITLWGQYQGEFNNVFSSIFVFLGGLEFPSVMNLWVILLLVGFLVTSVDSAVLVLSMFSDKGQTHPSRKLRLLWTAVIALASIALLLLGEAFQDVDVLNATQKLLIVTSLPFALLMAAMIFFFIQRLRSSSKKASSSPR